MQTIQKYYNTDIFNKYESIERIGNMQIANVDKKMHLIINDDEKEIDMK